MQEAGRGSTELWLLHRFWFSQKQTKFWFEHFVCLGGWRELLWAVCAGSSLALFSEESQCPGASPPLCCHFKDENSVLRLFKTLGLNAL